MKSWLLLLTLGALALAACVTPAFSEEARTLTARWVLDVERGAAIENGIIIVKGERIAAVGREGEFAPEGVGALALTRLTSTLPFGVGATDPVTFAAISILLICVALLASYIPARRAARLDPMKALGHGQ